MSPPPKSGDTESARPISTPLPPIGQSANLAETHRKQTNPGAYPVQDE
jgi:hypothetical protein